MLHAFTEQAGLFLKDGIIAIAEALTLSNSRPGQIAGTLVFITIVLAAIYYVRTQRQIYSIRSLDKKSGRMRISTPLPKATPTSFTT